MTHTQIHKRCRQMILGGIWAVLFMVTSWTSPQAQANSNEAQAPSSPPELATVASVDLNRYQGLWYQIALYPNRFQKQCISNTTAQYKLLANGEIEVINACKTSAGKIDSTTGRARIKQSPHTATTTSKLEVSFAPNWLSWLPMVWGNYWVIQLADDYRYAVVGEPKRKYLWVLSKTPRLSAQDRNAIDLMLKAQGYDPTGLQIEPQP